LAGWFSETKPILISSSGAEGGDDQCEEREQEGGGGCEVGYVHRLIQLVGEEDQEDKERDNEEAVTQGRVGRGPPLVGVDVGHPQQDAGEDDGVEDAHKRDAEHDPEGDEGDLPGPGDDAVQLESEEDELEDVDGAEELQLEGPIVANSPHTDGN